LFSLQIGSFGSYLCGRDARAPTFPAPLFASAHSTLAIEKKNPLDALFFLFMLVLLICHRSEKRACGFTFATFFSLPT